METLERVVTTADQPISGQWNEMLSHSLPVFMRRQGA